MTAQNDVIDHNAEVLEAEIEWFQKFLKARLEGERKESLLLLRLLKDIPPPEYKGSARKSEYCALLAKHQMSSAERIVLMLALVPHIYPAILDPLSSVNINYGKGFTEFGGIVPANGKGFLPTVETALFLLAGTSLQERFYYSKLFKKSHYFYTANILQILSGPANEPKPHAQLTISQEYLSLLTLGEAYAPDYSSSFPASKVTTRLGWDDLVLGDDTLDAVQEIKVWLRHGHDLLHDAEVGAKIKRGYRSLFYGPSGTGKTLTASLLGKDMGLTVYRIDLSMVVSKYIGETEKNLANIFDQAENKDWVLFFDEADALFGKRTQTSNSNDRYANQEVSFLLQRVEDFPGLVILASNFKSNMDPAFMRRFQSIIRFPMPNENLRMALFQKAFKGKYQLDEDIDIIEVCRKYELSGGNINNVLRYCAMMAIHSQAKSIDYDNFYDGLQKELKKIGKAL